MTSSATCEAKTESDSVDKTAWAIQAIHFRMEAIPRRIVTLRRLSLFFLLEAKRK